MSPLGYLAAVEALAASLKDAPPFPAEVRMQEAFEAAADKARRVTPLDDLAFLEALDACALADIAIREYLGLGCAAHAKRQEVEALRDLAWSRSFDPPPQAPKGRP